MKDNKNIAWLLLTAAVMLSLATTYGLRSSVAQSVQQDRKTDVPLLNYDAESNNAINQLRKEKDDRFNGRGTPDSEKAITELPEGVEPLPTNSHWWIGLPALPVEQSDVILLGEVVERQAHLSGDKSGIYSEFTVRVSEVFKDLTGLVASNGSVSANRVGGGVRFASGKVQKYSISRQGMPRKGGRYILFLRKIADSDFPIVTGYELSGGRVTPLDGEDDKDPRSALPFAQFRGADESRLLQDLRSALSEASSRRGAE